MRIGAPINGSTYRMSTVSTFCVSFRFDQFFFQFSIYFVLFIGRNEHFKRKQDSNLTEFFRIVLTSACCTCDALRAIVRVQVINNCWLCIGQWTHSHHIPHPHRRLPLHTHSSPFVQIEIKLAKKKCTQNATEQRQSEQMTIRHFSSSFLFPSSLFQFLISVLSQIVCIMADQIFNYIFNW